MIVRFARLFECVVPAVKMRQSPARERLLERDHQGLCRDRGDKGTDSSDSREMTGLADGICLRAAIPSVNGPQLATVDVDCRVHVAVA